MTFVEKFKAKSAEIDRSLNQPIEIVRDSLLIPMEAVTSTDEEMLVPEGPVYAIYKRSVAGKNVCLFYNLPKEEAEARCAELNTKAQKDRTKEEMEMNERSLEYKPEAKDILLYDVVLQGSEQESAYYNPKQVIRGEE